ncbi:MAG: MerR family transcriptional regulator, partial [Calditrichaceae bacterium]
LFPIGVVADILGVSNRILRNYEKQNIIRPSRSSTNRRLYSRNDIQKIEYIHYLNTIRKVNLAGIKEIFSLLDKLKDEKRDELLSEVEREIKNLSGEKKKILSGDAEAVK